MTIEDRSELVIPYRVGYIDELRSTIDHLTAQLAAKDAEVKRLRDACREVVVAIHEGKLDATSREASEKLAPLIERLIEIIVPQTTGASDAVAK